MGGNAVRESAVTTEGLTYLNQLPTLAVFRNHTGRVTMNSGMSVPVGIPHWGGGGDHIGWEEVTITPDMVGKKFARFLSVEWKRSKGGKRSPEQIRWANDVNQSGGRAVFLASLDDCKKEFPNL